MIQGVAAKWSFSSLSAKISVTSCKTTSCADFSFKGAPNLRQNFLWVFIRRFLHRLRGYHYLCNIKP